MPYTALLYPGLKSTLNLLKCVKCCCTHVVESIKKSTYGKHLLGVLNVIILDHHPQTSILVRK